MKKELTGVANGLILKLWKEPLKKSQAKKSAKKI